jgi:hypothetical protein
VFNASISECYDFGEKVSGFASQGRSTWWTWVTGRHSHRTRDEYLSPDLGMFSAKSSPTSNRLLQVVYYQVYSMSNEVLDFISKWCWLLLQVAFTKCSQCASLVNVSNVYYKSFLTSIAKSERWTLSKCLQWPLVNVCNELLVKATNELSLVLISNCLLPATEVVKTFADGNLQTFSAKSWPHR